MKRMLAGSVQVAAFQEVLRGGDIVLASHTGSGKTLAYLLPLVRPCVPCRQTTLLLRSSSRACARLQCGVRRLSVICTAHSVAKRLPNIM